MAMNGMALDYYQYLLLCSLAFLLLLLFSGNRLLSKTLKAKDFGKSRSF